jgi:hypothetical protein
LELIFNISWFIGKQFVNIAKGLNKCKNIKLLMGLLLTVTLGFIFKYWGYFIPVIYLIILSTMKPKELTKTELEEKLNEVDSIIFEIEDLKDSIYLDKREIKRLKKNKRLKELKDYTKGYIKTRTKERRKLKNLKFVIGNEKIKFGGMKND